MPEGPEIHRQAQQLRRLLEGREVQLECPFEPLSEKLMPLSGQSLRRVYARGKAFLLEFESGMTLYAHMQLYGRWKVHRQQQPPRTRRQLRLRLSCGGRSASLYSATDLHLLTMQELAQQPYLRQLGPDLLDPQVDLQALLASLHDVRFRGRQLASLLLDQNFWAGPGNYLRSEILFCAALTPELKPRQLSPDQATRLARAARLLAHRSLKTGGITHHPELVEQARQQRVPRRHYRHWVFGREGLPCWLCQQPLVKEVWSSRRLYRCYGCGGEDPRAREFPDLRGWVI